MKVLCVLNPLSGGGLPIQRWPEVESLLESFGVEHELLAEKDIPIDRQVVQRLLQGGADEFGAIAGIGGDGTQSAIINALMELSKTHPEIGLPPYGFIPTGVGNDIAKSFGLTSRADFFVNDLRRAVSTLVHGADYMLDLGQMNGIYFADAVTIGLDSHILRARNKRKKQMDKSPLLRRFAGGALLYNWIIWGRIARHRALDAEIIVDDEVWYSGPIVNLLINNTRIYAGEFDFCTNASSCDGLLDVVIFTGHRDYLSKYLLSLRRAPRDIRKMATTLGKESSHTQGRRIGIELSSPEVAQMDGEEIDADNKFDVEVVPRAIHIKTPAEP
jgi:diacylglycerol kinase family enzyme